MNTHHQFQVRWLNTGCSIHCNWRLEHVEMVGEQAWL